MGTVTIKGKEWTVYGTLDDGTDYIEGTIGPAADAWRALDADQFDEDGELIVDGDPINRNRTMVNGTRYLDSLSYSDDVDGVDYTDQAVRLAHPTFQQANYELMMLIAADPTITSKANQSSNIQSLQAGSASISFFNPTSVEDGTASTLPTILEKLLAPFLQGAADGSAQGSSRGGMWNGAECESNFDDCARFDRTEPL